MAAILDSPWAGQTFAPASALDIQTLAAAIVNQLASQINLIEIVHFPDKPEAYRMTHPVGAALVAYRGASYGAILDSAAIVQERTMKFEVRLMARDLGWAYGGGPSGTSPGAYALLEAIRAALTGFQIPGCRKLYPVKEEFIQRDAQGGVWVYAITFALSVMAVETSASPNYPLFIKGVAEERGGLTEIPVGALEAVFDSSGNVNLGIGNVSNVIVANLSGALYTAGADYSADAVNGIIAIVPGGAIAAGATVKIAYSYAETAVAISGQAAPLNQGA
ncbi:MAG: Gp37 family protein [Candidatus Binataceae bacterium]